MNLLSVSLICKCRFANILSAIRENNGKTHVANGAH